MANQKIHDLLSGKLIPFRLKPDKRWVAFLVFFGIATFLWFLAALEKSYNTNIDHPVIFSHIPRDKVVVNKLPDKLSLEVQGTGYDILRHNWDITKSQIDIKLNQFIKGISSAEEQSISIQSNQIKSRVTSQLNDLLVLNILPDSLVFVLSASSKKKIPVISGVSFELEKQYMIRDKIIIKPDSVVVTGPTIIMDTLSGIYTSDIRLKNLDHSVKRNLDIIMPNDQLKTDTRRVSIEIPVEQFTEKKLTIPVYPVNLPDSLNLKTFPATVQATFRVVISAYDQIQPEDFKIVVDYLDIEPGTTNKIKPKIMMAPGLIENPRIKPELMDYLLEQK